TVPSFIWVATRRCERLETVVPVTASLSCAAILNRRTMVPGDLESIFDLSNTGYIASSPTDCVRDTEHHRKLRAATLRSKGRDVRNSSTRKASLRDRIPTPQPAAPGTQR